MRTEFKVSPVFVPRVLVQDVGCHTIFAHMFQRQNNSTQQMPAYQCSPFCSSAAYSQDGKSIQIHPWCSHNPAHSRHCSHCIHLYLRRKKGKSLWYLQGPFLHYISEQVLTFVSLLALVCYAQVVMYNSLHLTLVSPPQWASPYMV